MSYKNTHGVVIQDVSEVFVLVRSVEHEVHQQYVGIYANEELAEKYAALHNSRALQDEEYYVLSQLMEEN